MHAAQVAPAASKRGMMVSAAPSSALRMMTFPSGAWPSPQGHLPPVVTVAVMAIVNWLLPVPGSPAKQVCLPRASRPASHATFSGSISAAAASHQRCSFVRRFTREFAGPLAVICLRFAGLQRAASYHGWRFFGVASRLPCDLLLRRFKFGLEGLHGIRIYNKASLKWVHAEHRPADDVSDGFFAEQTACRTVDESPASPAS